MDPYLALGIVGMFCILCAFLLNQMEVWKQAMWQYDLCNFIGSLLLVLYAYDGKVWPFFMLNMVWAIYSLKDLIVTFLNRLDRIELPDA